MAEADVASCLRRSPPHDDALADAQLQSVGEALGTKPDAPGAGGGQVVTGGGTKSMGRHRPTPTAVCSHCLAK
jgi:hypothetical protein